MKRTNLSMQDEINFRQRYIIVHSYIYYMLDRNVISDREYDSETKELVQLKNTYPDLWRRSEYYEQFGSDYNGATGFDLWYKLDVHQQEIIKSIVHMIIHRG